MKPSKLRKLLKGVGKRPKDIAKVIRSANVKGCWYDGYGHPLSLYLFVLFGRRYIFRVHEGKLKVLFLKPDIKVTVIKLPKAMRKFVKRLDDGKYRYLLADTGVNPAAQFILRGS